MSLLPRMPLVPTLRPWQHAKAGPGSGSLGGGSNLDNKRPRVSVIPGPQPGPR